MGDSSDFGMGYALGMDSNNSGNCNNGFGNEGGWGWFIWIILIFAIFGFGRNGWGNGGNGGESMAAYLPYLAGSVNASGTATRADLCSEFAFNDLNRAVEGVSNGLCNGFYTLSGQVANGFAGVDNAICSLGYNNAQLANGISTAMMQGFNAANVTALQGQNALQSQLAQCCCDLRTGQLMTGNQIERGFCDTNYNAATNTTAIIQNAHNDTDRVLAKLDAMESARKDETIADLRTKLAACGDQTTAQYIVNQVRNIVSPPAVPAYPAASPCGLGNWAPQVLANGYTGGCGCNTGCGF